MEEIVTETPEIIRWWERVNLQIEAEWRLFGEDLESWYRFRRWVIFAEGAFKSEYHGRRVFWLRGRVKVLGLSIGAGLFVFRDTSFAPLPRQGR